MVEENQEKTYTYEDLARMLGVTREYLWKVASDNEELLSADRPREPGDPLAAVRFSQAAVNRFVAWYRNHSRRRKVVNDPGDRLNYSEAAKYLGVNRSTFTYYQREYDMLYPDAYVNEDGHLRAYFDRAHLDAFRSWREEYKWERPGYEGGRPQHTR